MAIPAVDGTSGGRLAGHVLAASLVLLHLAAQAAPVPRSDAIYFVLVDRFADGDGRGRRAVRRQPWVDRADPQGFHGGDLRGLLDRLDHIAGLGVEALWISPVAAMQTEKVGGWGAFHGYWVTDLGEVEPRFGTWDDLRALRDALHARGMRLYVDMVYNHVGYDAPLVRERPEWFHGRGDIADWSDPEQVVTHDVHGLPDLAQEDEAVFRYLVGRSLPWAELADGFRIDAVRHLQPGFLARLKAELSARGAGEVELLGEVFEGDPDALAERMRVDDLSSVFDFPLHYAMKDVLCGDEPPGRLAAVLPAERYGGPERLVTFVDNHDVGRIRTVCGDERVHAALTFWLTARGRPCITWGTEIGLEGAGEPENRASMRFGETHPMGATLRSLLGLRGRWPALRGGRTTVLELTDDWLLIARATAEDAVLIGLNQGEAPKEVVPPVPAGLEAAWTSTGAGLSPTDTWLVAPGQVWVGRLAREEGFAELAEAPAPVDLEIRAREVPLQGGDRAVLVGSGRALGGWDPAAGVVGQVEGDGVRFTVPGVPGEVLAAKLVVLRGDEVVWEDRANRYVLVPGCDGGYPGLDLRWGR